MAQSLSVSKGFTPSEEIKAKAARVYVCVVLDTILRFAPSGGTPVEIFDAAFPGLTVGIVRGVVGFVALHSLVSITLSLLFERASEDATELFTALQKVEQRAKDSTQFRQTIEETTSRPMEWMEKTSKKMRRTVQQAKFAFDASDVNMNSGITSRAAIARNSACNTLTKLEASRPWAGKSYSMPAGASRIVPGPYCE